MAFIAPPDGWSRITDAGELLAFSKQLKLTPKTFTEPKPLVYSGAFTKEPVPCRLVGYVDKSFVVIEVSGQLHTIHSEYLRELQTGSSTKGQLNKEVYTCIDIETTGTNDSDHIIELGALRVENSQVAATFSQLIHSPIPVSPGATATNGITDDMLIGMPAIADVLPKFLDFIGDSLLVGHNINGFDIKRLNKACRDNSLPEITNSCCDTMQLAAQKLGKAQLSLQNTAKELSVRGGQAHRALGDCQTTYEIYEKLRVMEDNLDSHTGKSSPSEKNGLKTPNPSVTSTDIARFKSRPKAKDIHPTSVLFDPAHPLYDMTCVITGELQQINDRDAMQRIADCGGHNADNVTRKTDLLIVGSGSDPEKKSGKVKKAEEYIAKGLPVRIITEEQFLNMLDETADQPTSVEEYIEKDIPVRIHSDENGLYIANPPLDLIDSTKVPSASSEAERIFHEMQDALATAQENYDSEKIQLNLRKPEKATAYHAIELFGQSCLNFKGSKTLYAEISPKIDALFAAEHIVLDDSRANAWARIPAQELSFADHPQLVIEIYEKYLITNGFDCCSRYLECSEAERCTHPDIMVAGQCTYRQRLRAGQIFYGSKRNV